MTVALPNQNGGVDKTTVTLDSVAGWSRQRLQVVVIDADRKGETENCWLDKSEQRAKEGLTKCFEVIGLNPGVPRHEALEIAWIVGHVVTVGPPRFAAWTRSALLATDAPIDVTQKLRGASASWRFRAGRWSRRCRAIRAHEFPRM